MYCEIKVFSGSWNLSTIRYLFIKTPVDKLRSGQTSLQSGSMLEITRALKNPENSITIVCNHCFDRKKGLLRTHPPPECLAQNVIHAAQEIQK